MLKCFLPAIIVAFLAVAICEEIDGGQGSVEKDRKPNIIIFLADDVGYADLLTFGNPVQEHGAIDRMAEEGMKFTQWTAGGALCSPSRASMLTGRYPLRTGVYGNSSGVFVPNGVGGLPRSEVTIAEALGDVGYTTGMVGKWHLGVNKENHTDGYHLPMHHGFDYVGNILPMSQHWYCKKDLPIEVQARFCFLYDNAKIVEQPINLESLTQNLVNSAKDFIQKNKRNRFFLYFALTQAHVSMMCNPDFCGKSKRGAYGDNINEMAWAVGEVLDLVKDLEIEKDTLAFFTSDQGPQDMKCVDEGSSGIFRGGKRSTWEGGFRVPAVAWWPGKIQPGGSSTTLVNSMDILPTALYLAGAPDYLSQHDITIDGQLIGDIVKSVSDEFVPPREVLFYYYSDILMAVRYKKYKIHYWTYKDGNVKITASNNSACESPPQGWSLADGLSHQDPPLVFDLMTDTEEQLTLDTTSAEVQALLEEVKKLVEDHTSTMKKAQSEFDKGNDDSLRPCCNFPACTCNYEG